MGETAELKKVRTSESRVGRELSLVLVGPTALTAGSIALVGGLRRSSGVESTQARLGSARLGLILVGFATAFELVVLV